MSTRATTALEFHEMASASPRCVCPPDASTLAPGLRLLPAGVRDDVYRLYGALREIDDAVDYEHPDATAQLSALEEWSSGGPARTRATYALNDLRRRHPLSHEPFADLCNALRDDLERVELETENDLERYCSQVGGSVAIMVAELLGAEDSGTMPKIATLGQAMQLTNVLRDIDVDRARGRVYIPSATIRRLGKPDPGMREELLREKIRNADRLYGEGFASISMLARGRRGIAVCAALYREILRQIEREALGRRAGTVDVPGWRRRFVIARSRVLPLAP
jgi:15-cis-phytoene synthase